ncbi:MAG: histone deacetylase [Methanomassiliicoccaceae archaeon]|nr:histone deacetylase [Methanomassiliicoccaceae archaeon]
MAIVYHSKVLEHVQWEDHPESPFRIKTLTKKLKKERLWGDVISPIMINDEDVLKVHTEDHLASLKCSENVMRDQDTLQTKRTYGLAMLSASIAKTAVGVALSGVPTLAITRPPGHHAEREYAGGFCYLNNVAIAVEAAGVRTAIIDLDAHHGNGTEEIFYGRDDVLFIDCHESELYTGTGQKEDLGTHSGEGYTINIPLPPGSGNRAYRKAMNEIIIPIIREYGPELIVVSLGVDAHYCDPNSNLRLSTQGYVDACKALIKESVDGKIAFVLEGGYHLRATAEVVAGVLAAFEGKEIVPEYNEDMEDGLGGVIAVENVRKFLKRHWNI